MGKVEEFIASAIKRHGTICFALIDSEGISPSKASNIAKRAEDCGVEGILIGGSTAIDQIELHDIVIQVKQVTTKPVILFPGNVTGVTPNADAILFSCLLNSDNPYFITEAQALGALAVRKHHLEALPMGYLIIGDGGTTGFIGRARGIPYDKPQIAAMYALGAQYMGMRFLYLEAGSGVMSHVSEQIIATVRRVYDGTLIVGGGIKNVNDAINVTRNGANILVLGTLLESDNFDSILKDIITSVRDSRPSM